MPLTRSVRRLARSRCLLSMAVRHGITRFPERDGLLTRLPGHLITFSALALCLISRHGHPIHLQRRVYRLMKDNLIPEVSTADCGLRESAAAHSVVPESLRFRSAFGCKRHDPTPGGPAVVVLATACHGSTVQSILYGMASIPSPACQAWSRLWEMAPVIPGTQLGLTRSRYDGTAGTTCVTSCSWSLPPSPFFPLLHMFVLHFASDFVVGALNS